MMKFLKIFLPVLLLVIITIGCKEEPMETPTKGYLKLYVDESLVNVMKKEVDLFVDLYKESKIEIIPVKAREGIASLLNGESKMFVSSRALNDEEKTFAQKAKPEMKTFKFCYDGIAVIANKNSTEEKIGMEQLKDVLIGKNKKIKIVIPEKNSGIYEYLKKSVLAGAEPSGAEILSSENLIIENVKQNKNRIGLVGVDLLNNEKDVKILPIGSNEKNVVGNSYYKPHAAYFVSETYPLVRTSYIFLDEIGLKVASGFTTFLTSSEGQRIVMKENLGPATVPVKIVQLN